MLDFVAWACTFISTLALGAKKRWGWLFLAVGSMLWACVGLLGRYQDRRVWGLVLGSACTTVVAVRNWRRWRL